jgi:hypothetical protein
MGMKFIWRFTSDAGTVTASSTAKAGTAAKNLQRDALSKKWQSGGTLATETITFDLGLAQPITSFALWGHNITETETITLEYADDSGFTTGTGTVAVTWRETYLLEFFASVTKRYWRLSVLKDAAADVKEAGRMVLGPYYELTNSLRTPGDSYGTGRTAADKDVRTEGGVKYSDLGVPLDGMSGTITGLTEDDVDEVELLKKTYQTSQSFVAAADWDVRKRRVLYGSFDNLRKPQSVSPTRWSITWNMTGQE